MREYRNLNVCVDCLVWIANGDDADGAYLDTSPDKAREEIEVDPDSRRAADLREYLGRVAARESWGRDGWDLAIGHIVEDPDGHPGPYPDASEVAPDAARGLDAADARERAATFRRLADLAWEVGEAAGLGAESSPYTWWGDRAADYAAALYAYADETAANESDEGHFSWSGCDCCDSELGGTRYRACAWRRTP